MADKKKKESFFAPVKRWFSGFFDAVVHGDIWVKSSLVIMGAGHIRRKKFLYGIFITLFEALFILFLFNFASVYLTKFNTLGTVKQQVVYNPATMKNEFNDYDNSFLILLYGLLSIVAIIGFIAIWIGNAKRAYELQKTEEEGRHILTIRENLREILDGKFHRTLLFLPLAGICLFTIIPLIVMICVAFTNYDQQHFPPAALFTWTGLSNFRTLFTNSLTSTFGYSFAKVLLWTLEWAILATATCYIGGILLALLINNKRTRWKKMWRTCFIVAMAVPQFVSLLLVRSFFADSGIVNTFCARIGLTELLKNIGLVPSYLNYIPFLTNAGWAKFMIIMINIWVGVPYLLLIATGILMNIPSDLYEAATIDGANAFQRFRSITMPYMLFVTGPYLINSVVQNISNFNVIYLLTNGVFETADQLLANSHARETDLLVTWLFRLTNEYYNYKMASVIGIMVFVVCTVITLIAFNIVTRDNNEERMQG